MGEMTLIFNLLYFLKMCPNFDVRFQIKPNPMAIYIDFWPCLITTNLSCSSEVFLMILSFLNDKEIAQIDLYKVLFKPMY